MRDEDKTKEELINELTSLRIECRKLQCALEQLPIGLVIADEHGKITIANEAANAIFGQVTGDAYGPSGNYTLHNLTGSEYLPEELPLPRSINSLEVIIGEEILVRTSNAVKHVYATSRPIFYNDNKLIGALAIMEDITERGRIERERESLIAELSKKNDLLYNERSKLQAILEALPAGVFISDGNGRITAVNSLVNKIWGGKAPLAEDISQYQEYIGWWADSGELVAVEEWALARAVKLRQISVGEIIDILKFDGTKGTILNSASPVIDRNGNVIGGVAVILDITYQQQIEKELRRHQQELEKMVHKRTQELAEANNRIIDIIDSMEDGFFALNQDWQITYINRYLCSLLNVNREELIGVNLWDTYPNHINSSFYHYCHQAMHTNAPISFEFEFANYGYYEVNIYTYTEGISVFVKDVAERKKYERELIRLSALDLIGQMAAGISHEIRNPLATVRGFLELISLKEDYSNYQNHFKIMIEELDRTNYIITEFLSMSSSKKTELQKININSIIQDLAPLISADALSKGKYLSLETANIPDLSLNKNEMRQLILNLCRNGIEAMTDGKCLTITTYCQADCVILAVKDQGEGIKPEVLEKLGTPFFTTKKNGTGLGLGVCYGIATRHNAKIDIETSDEGTTFFVSFKID